MDELDGALQYLLRARKALENSGSADTDLWFARAKLEAFLAKLSLRHGFEETNVPKIKGRFELKLETIDKLVEDLKSAIESYRLGRIYEAFKAGWVVREVLTKLL